MSPPPECPFKGSPDQIRSHITPPRTTTAHATWEHTLSHLPPPIAWPTKQDQGNPGPVTPKRSRSLHTSAASTDENRPSSIDNNVTRASHHPTIPSLLSALRITPLTLVNPPTTPLQITNRPAEPSTLLAKPSLSCLCGHLAAITHHPLPHLAQPQAKTRAPCTHMHRTRHMAPPSRTPSPPRPSRLSHLTPPPA